MIKISIIIPVYNAEMYLSQCLESVLKQPLDKIEIICVNDGSIDNSLKLLNQYALQDTRIKVIDQPNQNAGVARNNGLKVAQGEYVHFLDADDWILPNLYTSTYKVAQEEHSDIVMFNYKCFDNITHDITSVELFNSIVTDSKVQTFSFNQKPRFLIECDVMPWNKLYKRSFLLEQEIEFDDLKCANDRSFYYKTIVKAKRISILPEALIMYRVANDKSLVGKNRLKNFECHFKSYESVAKYTQEAPLKIRVGLFDVALDDIFYFYDKATGVLQYDILKQIQEFLKQQKEYNKNLVSHSRLCNKIEYLLKLDLGKFDAVYLEQINQMLNHPNNNKNRFTKKIEYLIDFYRECGFKQTLHRIKEKFI